MPNTVPAADTGLPTHPLPRFAGVNDDPAFAAIKAHHAATMEMLIAHCRVEDAERAMRNNIENATIAWLYREAEKAHTAAQGAEREAERQLIRTKPTTSAGIAALFKYAVGDIHAIIGTLRVGWASDLLKTVGATLDAQAREDYGTIRCFNANAVAARKAREAAEASA